ncbi:hypothetical protein COT63_00715 [Candidatus Shapirobacteria bacterium CG09_land_8_20_14_0_10_38_17]|uniref:Glycosyltransferase RgtA/B/C/D-like domain-containing protein n=1 Tax=Candidatus Shapirobacteria bacterium CG09_land_8_20_14_0_10_38_17 TaxID=1974884 RepID=A0A2H0WRL2_9BACT|nr:MAG: hypothetical protein COT63_00715 [Candidatus Shapirobacteria bacterium CG09_land_8_20_14_0_10_38_17]
MDRFFEGRWHIFFLFLIIFFWGFLRFYKVSTIANFAYDQARDTDKIRQIIQEKKITLLGPSTSISTGRTGYSTTYFGPIYYYLLIPFLWLAKFDPVGPIMFTAFLGILSIFLLYLIVERLTKDKRASLVASFLYAISPAVIEYSRFIWNTNFIPFFALLLFMSLLNFKKDGSKNWSFASGFLCGVLTQLHFYTYFLTLFAIIFVLFLGRKKKPVMSLVVYSFGFILGIFPMIVFDLRHNFLNSRSIFFNLFHLSDYSNESFGFSLNNLVAVVNGIIVDFIGVKKSVLKLILIMLVGSGTMLFLLDKKAKKRGGIIIFLLFWGLLSSSIFSRQGGVEKRFLLPLSPFIFIFLGLVFSQLSKKRITLILSAVLGGILVFFIFRNAIKKNFITQPVSLGYCRENASLIIKEAKREEQTGVKINIANLADLDRRATCFRYFVNLTDLNILGLEHYPDADILYVIDKKYGWDGIVNNTDTWEVYSFQPKVLLKVLDGTDGVKIYKIGKRKNG